jgi:hypothetical protein
MNAQRKADTLRLIRRLALELAEATDPKRQRRAIVAVKCDQIAALAESALWHLPGLAPKPTR